MFNFTTDVFQTLLWIFPKSEQKSSFVMTTIHMKFAKSYDCKTEIELKSSQKENAFFFFP